MATSDHLPGMEPADGGVPGVLGVVRRSLFDAVRPSTVQRAGDRLRGPGGMVLAALHTDGVTGGGGMADAVVLGGRVFGPPGDGWLAVPDEGRALGVAYGMARARRARHPVDRTWCLVRASTLADGRTLELLAMLADLPAAGLVPVLVGQLTGVERATGILQAMGVRVWSADNDDAWSVLSALDHARRYAVHGTAAVVASRDGEAD